MKETNWGKFLRRTAVLSITPVEAGDSLLFFSSLTAASAEEGRCCLHPLQNSTLRISKECSAEWRIHTERLCQILLYVSVLRLLLRFSFSKWDSSSSSDAPTPPIDASALRSNNLIIKFLALIYPSTFWSSSNFSIRSSTVWGIDFQSRSKCFLTFWIQLAELNVWTSISILISYFIQAQIFDEEISELTFRISVYELQIAIDLVVISDKKCVVWRWAFTFDWLNFR